MDDRILTQSFDLRARDTDVNGRLKISSAQLMMQEIAEDHSALLGYSRAALAGQDLVWLLSRSRLEFTRLPQFCERLTLSTWPLRSARSIYPRCYSFAVNGQTVGHAVTQWLLVRPTTRAMVDGAAAGIVLPDASGLPQPLKNPARIRPEGEPNEVFSRRVCFSDLDVNGHVNNARYAEWLLDAVDPRRFAGRAVRALQVNYLHEMLPGETVALSRYDSENGWALLGEWEGKLLFEASVELAPEAD